MDVDSTNLLPKGMCPVTDSRDRLVMSDLDYHADKYPLMLAAWKQLYAPNISKRDLQNQTVPINLPIGLMPRIQQFVATSEDIVTVQKWAAVIVRSMAEGSLSAVSICAIAADKTSAK